MNEMLKNMAHKVKEFNDNVTHCKPNLEGISDERMRQRIDHMAEELQEIHDAHHDRNDAEVVDGLVDLIYLAIGTLLEMGVSPDLPFDTVHQANMKKQSGKSERNGNYEAHKPEGWQPPDHTALLERVRTLNQVSPIFVELTKLRAKKGANYNRGTVKRIDHFPLGHASFFQMVWVKAIRLRSFVESAPEPNNQTANLIERELNDLMAYACFWAEFIKGIEI